LIKGNGYCATFATHVDFSARQKTPHVRRRIELEL